MTTSSDMFSLPIRMQRPSPAAVHFITLDGIANVVFFRSAAQPTSRPTAVTAPAVQRKFQFSVDTADLHTLHVNTYTHTQTNQAFTHAYMCVHFFLKNTENFVV